MKFIVFFAIFANSYKIDEAAAKTVEAKAMAEIVQSLAVGVVRPLETPGIKFFLDEVNSQLQHEVVVEESQYGWQQITIIIQ